MRLHRRMVTLEENQQIKVNFLGKKQIKCHFLKMCNLEKTLIILY